MIDKSKNILFILMFLYSLNFASGCNNSYSPEVDAPIRLGLLRVEDNLPFFIAAEDGLFAKYGLNVEIITFNSARERDIALQAGKTDGELADFVALGLLKKGGTRAKVVSLGLGATSGEGRFALLAAPNSGIVDPAQLMDVPVAVSQNTIINYLAEAMLKEKGVPDDHIKLLNIPDINIRLAALLAENDVKAALLPDPQATLAEKSGAQVVIDDTTLGVNLSQSVIIFREDFLLKHPEKVKKILRSYEEGALSLNSNHDKYKHLIQEKALIPAPLSDSYNIPTFSKLQLPTPEMVNRVMAWMSAQKLLAETYSYDSIVSPGFIPSERG